MPRAGLAKIMTTTALMAGLAACQTAGPATVRGECRLFRPISSSADDTAETRREVVAHNRVGTAACGWRPER